MPPKPLHDLSTIDFDRVIADREAIYKINPHGPAFQQLDGIYFVDRGKGTIGGYRDVRHDEFWIDSHIPGRPIFPGVLMVEAAAQLVSYFVMSKDRRTGFLGFGGVDDVKFRGAVMPGQRILVLGLLLEERPRRCVGATQAFVEGQMVYEGRITGMWL